MTHAPVTSSPAGAHPAGAHPAGAHPAGAHPAAARPAVSGVSGVSGISGVSGTGPALLADRFNTLRYDPAARAVIVLDRRAYPFRTEYVTCHTLEEVASAIETMVVQGGPPLAYVAGLGLALQAELSASETVAHQRETLAAAAARLARTRRTADDLHHILRDTLAVAEQAFATGTPAAPAVLASVNATITRGNETARRCGAYAATLVQDGDRLLTHCYPGAALNWMLYLARAAGRTFEVVVTETRPYWQGARLTASQARDTGLSVTLVTDGMPAFLMARGRVTKLITAADRITLDGHIVNKVGTYQLAIAAHFHGLPFYVLGYDGPDPLSPTAAAVEIEERNPQELFTVGGTRTAVEGIGGYYPAFDITPPHLVSAIVTDRGIWPAPLIAHYSIPHSIGDAAAPAGETATPARDATAAPTGAVAPTDAPSSVAG